MALSNIKDVMSLEDTAKVLHMSKQTLYQKINRREIPFIKMPHSSRVFFSRTELANWLNSGSVSTKIDRLKDIDGSK